MITAVLHRPAFRRTARLFVTIVALAFWQGGLTFYAVVVVPVGNSILTGGEQGFVTQAVTNWLNRIGLLVVLVLIAHAVYLKSRAFWGLCLILAVTLAGLFAVHMQMDTLLDPASFAIADRDQFEVLHEEYLVLVTIQWCAALAAGWLLLSPDNRGSA